VKNKLTYECGNEPPIKFSILDLQKGIAEAPLAIRAARGVPRQKLIYQYDWVGRRVSKVVSNWTGSARALPATKSDVKERRLFI